jgi:serine/threonine protein kinase
MVPGFAMETLLREAEVLAKLQHPFIISFKDLFQTDTTLYIVTVRGVFV